MSGLLASRIEKGPRFKLAPLRSGRGKRQTVVIGFDSEAENGKPFMMQFSKNGTADDVELKEIPLTKRAGLRGFTTYLEDNCNQRGVEYVVFGYNLLYEFTQLFADLPTRSEPEFVQGYTLMREDRTVSSRWQIHVYNDKRYFAEWKRYSAYHDDDKEDRPIATIRLLDASSFYQGGLNKNSVMLGLGEKEETPVFKRSQINDAAFRSYARQDAYLTRLLGERIIADHVAYDVRTCISAPHFASSVFRRHFLNTEIPLPDPELEQAGLSSYHGGKNGYYLDGPQYLPKMYSYDITSAYPEAMRQLPNIETATWHNVGKYTPGVHALWKITGTYTGCKYHGMMTHKDGWQIPGYVDGVWITSYELDAMIASGEFKLSHCTGFVMTGEPGGPLTRYVDRFFEMKLHATGPVRILAKLLLNSLYGKFFQKQALGIVGWVDVEDIDSDKPFRYVESDETQAYDYKAGGLYHPPIASLITGYVRARIHLLEHKYQAVMTSTDGFFAYKAPDPTDCGTYLGGLTVATGDLSAWRERLYSFAPADDADHAKYALHGFRGSHVMLKGGTDPKTGEVYPGIPLAPGQYDYVAQQVITNKLAGRKLGPEHQVFAPGVFAHLPYRLTLDSS